MMTSFDIFFYALAAIVLMSGAFIWLTLFTRRAIRPQSAILRMLCAVAAATCLGCSALAVGQIIVLAPRL